MTVTSESANQVITVTLLWIATSLKRGVINGVLFFYDSQQATSALLLKLCDYNVQTTSSKLMSLSASLVCGLGFLVCRPSFIYKTSFAWVSLTLNGVQIFAAFIRNSKPGHVMDNMTIMVLEWDFFLRTRFLWSFLCIGVQGANTFVFRIGYWVTRSKIMTGMHEDYAIFLVVS